MKEQNLINDTLLIISSEI